RLDGGRHVGGHADVHGTRTDAGRGVRCARGPVRDGRGAVRVSAGPRTIRGEFRGGAHCEGAQRAGAGSGGARSGNSSATLRSGGPAAGQGAGGTARQRGGVGAAPLAIVISAGQSLGFVAHTVTSFTSVRSLSASMSAMTSAMS